MSSAFAQLSANVATSLPADGGMASLSRAATRMRSIDVGSLTANCGGCPRGSLDQDVSGPCLLALRCSE